MTEHEPNIEDFMAAAMAAGMQSAEIQNLLAAYPTLVSELAGYDPCKLAATFGGLLTVPDLQSNCLRLEALCHLALLCAHGNRNPNIKAVERWFAALDDGPIGRMEDPAEDVFVTSIATERGNFCVIEGIWESAGFFLQRFLNVLGKMPATAAYEDIREAVYGLLTLSDVVCGRAGLVRWQMGGAVPHSTLPPRIAGTIRKSQAHVSFTEEEIAKLGISLDQLTEFVFRPRERGALAGDEIGHTLLERRPVLWRNKDVCLALPTGVSAAIRRYILERMEAAGLREAFLGALSEEYATTFAQIPLLGGRMHAPIRFQRTPTGMATAVMTRVDMGRHLIFVFVMDTLEDVETTGIAGMNDSLGRMEDVVAHLIADAAETAQQDVDFQEGIALIVSCGIGRGVAAGFQRPNDPRWRLAFLSAPDLVTLSWTVGFKPLNLFRLLDAQNQIAGQGVYLQNVNGLLNMAAWQRELRGHLVPHERIPDGFLAQGAEAMIIVDQTALKSLRQEVAVTWDAHVALDIAGAWIHVRKLTDSLFEEDAARPLYIGEQPLESGWLPAAFIASGRSWWCEMVVPDDATLPMAHARWQMLTVWLARIAAVLDGRLPGLPPGAILWRVEFEANLSHGPESKTGIGFEDAKQAITIAADRPARTVGLRVGWAFEAAHFNVENIAERALVARAVDGFLELAGSALTVDERTDLVTAIVPDVHARQTHVFLGRSFRDHIQEDRGNSVVLISEDDAAALRLGLGWRLRDRKEGCDLYGKGDCGVFLNAVTRMLEEELLSELATFDRAPLIEDLLRNHERACIDRDRWSRTAAAAVALHDDKQAAFNTIAEHEGRLNAVFQSTRILIEVAQCACPPNGGRKAGKLDLSRLMAKMSQIVHLGGWSDAIRHDAMEARVHINPLGDIQVNHDFIDTVIDPFGRAAADVRTKHAIGSYARHLEDIPSPKAMAEAFEVEFQEALREELGVGIDEMRLFLDFLQNIGMKENRLVLTIPRSALLDPKVGDEPLPPEIAAAFVAALTLPLRDDWHTVPAGYEDRDRQPWRYRRRLSVLRKPFIQIDDKPDPTLMIAPGLAHDGMVYTIGNYYRGDFPQGQLKPKMKSWRGKASAKRGTDFNTEVAERLRALGWQADPDVNMSAILGSAFKPLGDIDVLAWNPQSGRVLLIECKDLKYSKTLGEIAEQLADFNGEVRENGKPDDLLKHLNRIDAIRNNLPDLIRLLKFTVAPAPEGQIVFRNPVPMQFAWERLKERISLHLFDGLNEL
ncbi:hypothetical protein [Telmatospirillum siberiense]|uniref:hypothetical protein n=1 Tax=Telmatospirillum siberiense TaxID=382514 RepID=UPI0011AF01FB|nr:hypothetical protein [Telmatospirillum siberiense]